ncbi:ABC transporter substrate-binding protein [Caldivirga maquilingensis]|uniref:Periplasmic binding protein n=1 Tax=Caldivirga maquilingensis (strain ATCC 700844 / DSM 13496 / JCM 10307 / IC-167) TaxID=397948 RepID=A8MDX6_CALMQ|nr:ABC transporter substrate-binding protein [Caldivirga maquilingensis]ABW01982.1 periplasmic binding protein [Caldivirga maquilingensis IC-167]
MDYRLTALAVIVVLLAAAVGYLAYRVNQPVKPVTITLPVTSTVTVTSTSVATVVTTTSATLTTTATSTLTTTAVTTVTATVTPVQNMRIASLDPACSQIIFTLGLGNKVVLIDTYSEQLLSYFNVTIPSNATVLTSIWPTPSIEAVVNASPTVVCYDLGFYGTSTLASFSSIGLPLVIINGTADRTFQQIEMDVYSTAKALGVPERGLAVASWMNNIINGVRSRVTGLSEPTVVFMGWNNPIYAPSNLTFIGYEITIAGGLDVVNTTVPWPTITPSQLIVYNPDYIIASNFMGNCTATLEAIMQVPGINYTKAVKEGHVYVLGNLATSLVEEPGPLSVYGAEVIAAILHPEAFGLSNVPQCVSGEWVISNLKPTLPSQGG